MAENLFDIEEEKQERPSLEKKEPAETKKPTVDDLLEAFQNSAFFKKGYFTCPITLGLMLDPVVLNGSGQSIDRSSAVQLIENALSVRKAPICPITNAPLTITVSRNKATDPLQPESYFVGNQALKSIISDSIQDFRDVEGDKYQRVPDPMTKSRDIIQPLSLNPVAENDELQNEPFNRNIFFTPKCQEEIRGLACIAGPVSSLSATAVVRGILFPTSISYAQVIMLAGGSFLCCMAMNLACVELVEFGGKAEAWYWRDEASVDAVTEVLEIRPLIMDEGNEEDNGDEGGPSSASQFSFGRM